MRDAESVPEPLRKQFNDGDASMEGPIAPTWDVAQVFGQWSAATSTEAGDERANVFAVRVFPGATVGVQMHGVEPSQHELAERATRMVARWVQRSASR
jgi:hypothetical protein